MANISSKEIQISFLDYPTLDWCISVYFIGCAHFCVGCHNPELASVDTCDCVSINKHDLKELILNKCKRNKTKKVCFLGGDPLHPTNRNDVEYLIKQPEFDVCVYTGYDFNDNCETLSGYEFLKCGKYDHMQSQQSYKDDYKFVLGSKNQELYDRNGNCISINGTVNLKGTLCK